MLRYTMETSISSCRSPRYTGYCLQRLQRGIKNNVGNSHKELGRIQYNFLSFEFGSSSFASLQTLNRPEDIGGDVTDIEG